MAGLPTPAPVALPLAALLLAGCAGSPVSGNTLAGAGEARPAAVEVEAAHLQRYVLLVCLGASYSRLDPPPGPIVGLLQDEAWVFVEKGTVGPEAYERLHALAMEAGRRIPPEAAVRGCLDWSAQPAVRRAIGAEAQRSSP